MTVRNPQLFVSADSANVHSFVIDPAWALEQKVDGMRCLTVITNDAIEFYTRGGKLLKSTAAMKHFAVIRESLTPLQLSLGKIGEFELVLDAEIMPDIGKLVLLDMPYFERNGIAIVQPTETLESRRDRLAAIDWALTDYVVLVRHARTEDDKAALYFDVHTTGGEGLIAKRLDSPYSEGIRVKHSLKLKFTETADVVVTGVNVGESKNSIRGGDKINYEFAVYDIDAEFNQMLTVLGTCSGIGKDAAKVGDVIEVEYLYVGAGGRLVQPRMVKTRPDKTADDCLASQLKHYSKDVL